uniref:NUDIX domain-containing protein n=1 Tax=candidate division WWE3 bacterium TaxID=2053526 RepID=A0A832E1K3_UNCKA
MAKQNTFLAVRAVLTRRDKKVLLILRSGGSHRNPHKWELPGGGIQPGEPLGMALKREVKEETRLLVSPKYSRTLTFFTTLDSSGRYVVLVYLCPRFRQGKVVLSPEHENFKWTTIEAAFELPLTPETEEVMSFLAE